VFMKWAEERHYGALAYGHVVVPSYPPPPFFFLLSLGAALLEFSVCILGGITVP